MEFEVFLRDSNQKNRSNDSVILYHWEIVGIIHVFSPGSAIFSHLCQEVYAIFAVHKARLLKGLACGLGGPKSFDEIGAVGS